MTNLEIKLALELLSSIKNPIDYLELHRQLNGHPLQDLEFLNPLRTQVEAICSLYQQLPELSGENGNQYFKAQLDNLRALEERDELEQKLKILKQELHEEYTALLDYLLTLNPEMAERVKELDSDTEVIKIFVERLEQKLLDLDAPHNHQRIASLHKAINLVLAELDYLGGSTKGIISLAHLREKSGELLGSHKCKQDSLQQIVSLKQRLIVHLKIEDINTRLRSTIEKSVTTRQAIAEVSLKIQTLPLSQQHKESLLLQLEQRGITKLLEIYRAKVNNLPLKYAAQVYNFFSSVLEEQGAFQTKLSAANDSARQDELSLCYLESLAEQTDLQTRLTTLNRKSMALEQLAQREISASSEDDVSLRNDIETLIRELPMDVRLPGLGVRPSYLTYYLYLSEIEYHLRSQITTGENLLEKMEQIIPLLTEFEQLRARYPLFRVTEESHLLLGAAPRPEENQRHSLEAQLKRCKVYQERLSGCSALEEQQNHNKHLSMITEGIIERAQTPDQASILDFACQIYILQSGIIRILASLADSANALSEVQQPEDPEEELPEFTNVPACVPATEIEFFAQLHEANLAALSTHPHDIQLWYQELYGALINSTNLLAASYKPLHVLKDILHALQSNSDMETINAYRRLCPHPKDSIKRLLAIKPNVPACNYSDSVENEPDEFYRLDEQKKKLQQRSYFHEAELLDQLLNYLRWAQKVSNDVSLADILPNPSLDPRYNCLKRHRGCLRLWEMIEDIFNRIVGWLKGQESYECSNLPCSFFHTKTDELIQEAHGVFVAPGQFG